MHMSNFDETKGRIEEAAGDLTDNDRLKHEGKMDQTAGKAKRAARKVKDKAEDLIDEAKEELERR
jgi:uncharacterized protein YjbJ (UPF0337 family)